MNFPTAIAYKQGAQGLVDLIEKLRVKKEQKLKEEITNMTLDDHLLFIKSIIDSYIGAELIKIHYWLPYLSKELVSEISKVLMQYGWNVETYGKTEEESDQPSNQNSNQLSNKWTIKIHNCDKNEYMYLPEVFINAGSNGCHYQRAPDYVTTTSDVKLTKPNLFYLYVRVDLNRILIQSKYFSLSERELEKIISTEK